MPSSKLSSSCASWLQWLLTLLRIYKPSPPVEPEPPSGPKKWTFMVYLAGDNNLEQAGRNDLNEMKAAGSTGDVNVIAQFDGMSDAGARRYYLRRGTALEDDVVARLPEINTGDGAVLADFLTWAQANYPAEHYALVLWNHGSGWKDDDIYRGLVARGYDPARLTRGQIRNLTTGNPSRAFFRATVEDVAEEALLRGRAILFDDTSADFLDNVEMKTVLDQAATLFGQRIDVLGCDACLMSMVEVAYQLKTSCRYFVASQEEEPGDGWPYDGILRRLIANANMSPDLLASVIVEEYNTFYRSHYPNLPVTQSALDLDKLDPLADALDALGDVLRTGLETDWTQTNNLISLALYDVQRFADRDYVDLAHFCTLLRASSPTTAVGEAAGRVADLLIKDRERTPIVAEGHGGPGMRHVNGVAIYLPEREVSQLYARLEFIKDHRWDEFLSARLSPRLRRKF